MPKIPFWIFILLAILHLSAVRVDTMDVDASQLAEISREMMVNGDYLHTYDLGADYLDKPPFLFWVSSLSMKVFGVNNLGYKLPSILFAFLAIYATYRLAKLLYDEATGRMAALILGTCQGMFLMTNDIRADTVLMSWVITSIWLIKEWDLSKKLPWLLAGFAALAFGMMSKGPVAVMVPVFAFSCDWAMKREWKKFFKPEYLLGICLVAILLVPMCIGLYQQYDMHPEKEVYQLKHVSGIKFFFWTQSFGRVTGANPWHNDVDLSFLLVNMLWSFLPWIVLFIPAIIINIGRAFKQKFRALPGQEWLSTGGFLFSYVVIGSSHYQLPHYIFGAFPLAAILTASLLREFFIGDSLHRLYAFMKPLMLIIIALLFIACFLLLVYVFPSGPLALALWVFAFLAWLYIVIKRHLPGKLIWVCASGIILVNIFVTNYFYVQLLQYQLGSQLGRYIKSENIPADKIIAYRVSDPLNSIHFYSQRIIHRSDSLTDVAGTYVVTMDEGVSDLQKKGYTFDIVRKGQRFKVSELTPEFLNPQTRSKALSNYYLLKLN